MQTRIVSAIEAATNTIIGYFISVIIGQIVYPMFGYMISLGDNAALTAIFVIASYIRSYTFRRLFSRWLNKVIVRWTKRIGTRWQHFTDKLKN